MQTDTNYSETSECPICMCEYSTNNNHQICSMKCGHLFGYSCILNWYNKRKTVLCPICGIKGSKSQLRIIYSNNVVSYNTDNQLQEKYLKLFREKNALEEEISKLKTEIEILKLNKNECNCKTEIIENSIKFHKTHIKIKNKSMGRECVVYDIINSVLLISGCKDGYPAIYKYFNTEVVTTKLIEGRIKHISNMKTKDGNLYFSIHDEVYIMNVYNMNIIYQDKLNSRITSLGIYEDIILVGDEKGFLTYLEYGCNKCIIKICNVPIHSIFIESSVFYIGTVLGVYEGEIQDFTGADLFLDNKDMEIFRKVDLKIEDCVCTDIFGDKRCMIVSYRSRNRKMVYYIKSSDNEQQYRLGNTQLKKYHEVYFNEYLYLVDESLNKIQVLSKNGERVNEYVIDEHIINYTVSEEMLVIIGESFLHLFRV